MQNPPIHDAEPNREWADRGLWSQARTVTKAYTYAAVAKDMQLSSTARSQLSAEINAIQAATFPSGFPNDWGNIRKRAEGHTVLTPLVGRWATAFNIPTNSPLLYAMFYDLLKEKIYQGDKKKSPGKKQATPDAKRGLSQPTSVSEGPSSMVASPALPSRFEAPRVTPPQYDEKYTVIAVVCTNLLGDDVHYTFTLDDIQTPGSAVTSLATSSDEVLKGLLLDRHHIDVQDLVLEFQYNQSHIFHGMQVTKETPFRTLLSVAFSARESPIRFRAQLHTQAPLSPPPPRVTVLQKRKRGVKRVVAADPDEDYEDSEPETPSHHPTPKRRLLYDVEEMDVDHHPAVSPLRHIEEASANPIAAHRNESSAAAIVPGVDLLTMTSDEKILQHDPTELDPYDDEGTTNPTTSAAVLEKARQLAVDDAEATEDSDETRNRIESILAVANDEVPLVEDWTSLMGGLEGMDPKSKEAQEAYMASFASFADSMKFCEQMVMELWKETCQFFQRTNPANIDDFTLVGMNRTLKHYQAMAVCWMARQVPLTRGGIVADEQGLGKTTESLVFCAVVAQLAYSHQHVRESPARHLAPDAPSDAKCAYSKRMMIPCVCEKDCPFFLKKWVPTGAQVIIVKAQTLVNWQHEFAKTFNTNFVHQAKLVLVLGHGQLKPKNAYISNYAGRISNEETGDPPILATNHVILTSQKSFTAHVHLQLSQPKWDAKWRKYVATAKDNYAFSNVVIDEAHENKLEKTNQMFREILPLYVGHGFCPLFLLTGTPIERGTVDLVPYIKWYNESWKISADSDYTTKDGQVLFNLARGLRAKCSADNFLTLQNEINLLFSSSSQMTSSRSSEALKSRIADTISAMILRRTKQTHFLGADAILHLPPIERHDTPLEPTGDDAVLLQKIDADLASDICTEHQRQLQIWRDRGSNPRTKPDMPIGTYRSKLWERRPAYAYPHLWRMKQSGLFPDGWTCTALSAKGILAGTEPLLQENAEELLKSSVRAQFIVGLIEDLDKEWRTYRQAVKADKTAVVEGKRSPKVVILSIQPIIAACTYECLRLKFPNKDIRFYHSDLNDKMRAQIEESFQDEMALDVTGNVTRSRKHQDSPQILVGTVGLLGTGRNLQRAKTLILTEPQFTSTLTSQAEGRVHRFGQTEKVDIYNLTSDTIRSDRDLTHRIHFRASLAGLLELERRPDDEESEALSDDDLYA